MIVKEISQETIADIVAEMRNEWAKVYFSGGTRRRDGAYCDNKFVVIEPSEVADRIEAAAKRLNDRLMHRIEMFQKVNEQQEKEYLALKSENDRLRDALKLERRMERKLETQKLFLNGGVESEVKE